MSDGFFPPDVRIRFNGKAEDGWSALGEARQLLFKALNMQLAGYPTPINLTRPLMNGGEVNVFLIGNQKIITITPPVFIPEEIKHAEEIKPLEFFGMLSGWVRNSALTGPSGGKTLTSWQPTAFDQVAYKLKSGWQSSLRLGVEVAGVPEHTTYKASQFSGSMKRWVQAILGMGVIDDPKSANYLDGAIPVPTKRPILMDYSASRDRTNGIIKTGPKNHWLVQVDKLLGLLVMPLPMLFSTTDPGYRTSIERSGDVGTLAILNEFGGLPSGEPFPTLAGDITTYIAAGKILRLLTSADLAPFYAMPGGYSPTFGWAFNDTGNEAHNTGWSWRDKDGGLYTSGSPRALFGEHWSIKITLSAHDISQLALHMPIGTGTASIQQVHEGQMDSEALINFFLPGSPLGRAAVPDGFGSYQIGGVDISNIVPQRRTLFNTPGDGGYDINDKTYAVNERWGATLMVFFDGDVMQRLKWVPEKTWSKGHKTDKVSVTYIAKVDPVCPALPVDIAAARSPWFDINVEFAATWSPSGFTGTPLELRQMNGLWSGLNPIGRTYDENIHINQGGLPRASNDAILTYNGVPPCLYVVTGSTPISDALYDSELAADYGAVVGPTDVQAGSFQYVTSYVAFAPLDCREGFVIAERLSNTLLQPALFPTPFPVFSVRQSGFFGGLGQLDFDPHPLGVQGFFPNDQYANGIGGTDNILFEAVISAGPLKQWVIDDGWHYNVTVLNQNRFPPDYVELRTLSYQGLPSGMLDVVTHPHQANWIGAV